MDLRFIFDIINAVKRELFHYRYLAVFVFMVATSAVLAYGYHTPKSYTSEAVLHADVSSMLRPLLSGTAEVRSSGQVNEAREIIYSRSMLQRVAGKANLLSPGDSEQQREVVVNGLRRSIDLRVSSQNYLNLSYTSGDPNQSFRVLSILLDEFMQESVQRKRSESRGAFEFIESQVQAYRRQLENAEQALKEFRTRNLDNSGNVQNRVQNLTSAVEELRLRIEETESLIEQTERQLESESPFREVTRAGGVSEIDERLRAMEQQLDTLRLSYHDNHPDIVAQRAQIAELQERKAQQEAGGVTNTITEMMENPVYENLRVRLTTAESDLEAQRRRLASQERLLATELQRAERAQEAEAEESELTRDYNVTRQVYEEMLSRRENARLSMTLDVEGQGVSYGIQEPASFPNNWNGLQMSHYGAAGPVLGFGAVFGLLGALVVLDGRVRSGRMLQRQLPEDVMLLTSVPHYNSSVSSRVFRLDVIMLTLVLVAFMVAYAGVLVFGIIGMEPEDLSQMYHERLEGLRALL